MIRNVGGSITIIRDEPNKPQKINHCIFCLRQLTTEWDVVSGSGGRTRGSCGDEEECEEEKRKTVPKAVKVGPKLESELVASFNRLLPLVHQDWQTRRYVGEEEEGECHLEEILDSDKPRKQFPHFPDLCHFCGEKFKDFHRIINELNECIKKIQNVILESRKGGVHCWRRKLIEENLKNNRTHFSKSHVQAVLGFLDGFGKTVSRPTSAATAENTEIKVEVDLSFIKEEINAAEDYHGDPAVDEWNHQRHSHEPLNQVTLTESISNKPPRMKMPRNPRRKRVKTARTPKPNRMPSRNSHKLFQKCYLCSASFLIAAISDHIRTHIGEYLCECPNPNCGRAFASPFMLERFHIRMNRTCLKYIQPTCPCQGPSVAGNYYFSCKCKWLQTCNTCTFTTTSIQELKKHIQLKHEIPTEKNYLCPLSNCGLGFTVKQSVQCHLVNHPSISPNQKCSECEEHFEFGSKMETHLREGHKIEDIISCKSCNHIFGNWQSLLKHMWVHRGDPACFICYICQDGTIYSRPSILEHHYVTAHQIGSLLQCEMCALSFSNQRGLQSHIQKKHLKPQEKGTFYCDHCGLCFSKPVYLNNHLEAKHGQGGISPETKKLFRCNIPNCGKAFRFQKYLKQHKIVQHSAYGKFKCEMDGCGKSFVGYDSLINHKLTRHGPIARKAKKTTRGQKRRSVKVYEECGETFSNSAALKIHKLIHTGERPFQCVICGQRFRQSVVMRRHIRAHETKGNSFRPNGPMKQIRKRVERK